MNEDTGFSTLFILIFPLISILACTFFLEYGRIYLVKERFDGEIRRYANITVIEEIADEYRVDYTTVLQPGQINDVRYAFLENLAAGLDMDLRSDGVLSSRNPGFPVTLQVTDFDIAMGSVAGDMPRISFKCDAFLEPAWYKRIIESVGIHDFAWRIPMQGRSQVQRMDDVDAWQR